MASGLPAPSNVAAPPPNALRTRPGWPALCSPPAPVPIIQSKRLVKVNYTGWTTDGKMFDSSVAPLQPGRKAEPMTLSSGRVIPGWTEGIRLMVVGEKRRFWIPEELAYKGRPGAPAGMLDLDRTPRFHARAEAAAGRGGCPADAKRQGRSREQGHTEGHRNRPSSPDRFRSEQLFDLGTGRKASMRRRISQLCVQ